MTREEQLAIGKAIQIEADKEAEEGRYWGGEQHSKAALRIEGMRNAARIIRDWPVEDDRPKPEPFPGVPS